MLINSFKVLFFFLFLIEGLYAQDEIYRNYTVEDGLPSSEVYYSLQDSKGYMWFATDAGVSRFNGYEFENFTTKNGLTDNTVFRISEDSKGRIWFAPFNGRICYYDNDTIVEPPFIKKNSLGSLNYLESFYVDSLDNVWIGSLYSGIFCLSKEGKQQQMITLPKGHALRTKVIEVEGKMIVGSLVSAKGMKALQSSHLTSLKFYKDTLIEEMNPTKSGSSSGIQKVARGNNFACYVKSSNLYIVDKMGRELSKHLHFLEETRVVYLGIKGSVLYLGVANQGLYKFLYNDGKLKLLNHEFEKHTISSVLMDKSQGVWCTTLSNGIYYLPLKAILKNKLPNQQVYDMAVDKKKNKLYVSLRYGNLVEVSDSIKKIEKLTKSLLSIYFNDEKGALYWSRDKNEELIKYKNERIEEIKCLKEGSHFKSMLIKDEKIFYVNSMGLNIVTDTSWYSSYNDKKSKLWCTSLAFHCGKLWVGTNEGLRILDDGSIEKTNFREEYLNLAITSMLEINDSTLAIGTKERGVLLIENEKIRLVLDQSKGVASDLIRCLDKDSKGIVWCGTNKGLTRVQKTREGRFICYNITKKHGLTSEDIISVKSLGDSLFVGTTKGILVINSKGLEPNSVPPVLYFNSFLVNSLKKTKDDIQFLKYNENNISISYLGLNYRSQGNVNYKYRLIGEGTDTNWVSTYSRLAQYTLLPPSDYLFEIKAENVDGVWSKAIKVPFRIAPPYWKTWWFIGAVMFSFSFLLFWVLYSFFKRRELKFKERAEKIELEKKMIELELKALRSQMSPHFIFNILNSIQHFMLQNNFKETNKYLTQFAKLIRIVLNLSEKNIITIGEELEMLKLYMNLEKMRFENGFDYEVVLDKEIDEDYDEIPSMLIQPYVENAIWHGLMNKTSKGKIFISIEIKAGYLFCIIEDNGVGLKKAKEIKAKRKKMKHKSIGMRITKDRLDLLNEDNNINVHIIDLETIPPNQKKGTRVEIKIPYNS